jgi:hypothetical protein
MLCLYRNKKGKKYLKCQDIDSKANVQVVAHMWMCDDMRKLKMSLFAAVLKNSISLFYRSSDFHGKHCGECVLK